MSLNVSLNPTQNPKSVLNCVPDERGLARVVGLAEGRVAAGGGRGRREGGVRHAAATAVEGSPGGQGRECEGRGTVNPRSGG